jgi:group II intron reverse transcriptase/maturase
MKGCNLLFDEPSLFEKLCSSEYLKEGFLAVKRNRGAAGIDGVTIDDFKNNSDKELSQLSQELEGWTYNPQPVRKVMIPKPDGGERMLGIPCVRDRVVQATMKMLLEPILDPKFSENSFGFRTGRNQEQAVRQAQKIVEAGKEYVVDIDLAQFFDRINHDRLIQRLSQQINDKRIIRLIGMTLRSGVMENGLVKMNQEGSVQGSPISPLLSNVVLDELDKELETRKLEFCRFADDCNIFVKSAKAAESVMASVSRFIESKLKLKVNQEKSKVALAKQVKFLGMTIIDKTRAISRKSMQRAMAKVKELTPRGTNKAIEETIKKINQWYIGWSNYYGMTQYPSQLAKIEAHIRRRLRARLVSQQKRRRNLFNKLVKLGVKKPLAAKTVFSNDGRWHLSHTRAVEMAYPNKWFIKVLGLKIRSEQGLKEWFSVRRWVNLS